MGASDCIVNGKRAIEWIMERTQVSVDKDSGIRNDPNDWAREHAQPRYIVDMLKRVVRVSLYQTILKTGRFLKPETPRKSEHIQEKRSLGKVAAASGVRELAPALSAPPAHPHGQSGSKLPHSKTPPGNFHWPCRAEASGFQLTLVLETLKIVNALPG